MLSALCDLPAGNTCDAGPARGRAHPDGGNGGSAESNDPAVCLATRDYFSSARGILTAGSPKSMNFMPWKKMLGGYQSLVGFRSASFSVCQ